MKHLFLLMAIAMAVVGCNIEDKKTAASTNPADSTTIQWIDPVDQNIGKVNQGEVVEILWHFKNSGSKPLVISRVTPGCGCTGAEGPKEPVAPGKEAIISAKFDSKNFSGTVHKTVTVAGNYKNKISDNPQDILGFSVEIKGKN
jgi:hypothetical protein